MAARLVWCCLPAVVVMGLGRAVAGPPFLTDDPGPVDLGHWEIDVFSAGAIQHGDATGVGPSVEVNYGAVQNLQLHAIVNLAYDSEDGSNRFGPGDTELGVKYRLVNPGDAGWWPQVGVFPTVELPSGSARHGLGSGTTQVFLPVWLQKDFGAWTTYGGAGYWITPGPGNRNFWFSGWELQNQVTKTLLLGAEVFHTTSATIGRSGATGFNVGGQYDFSEHHHLLLSAGRGGLTDAIDTTNVQYPFVYYIAYQLTF